MGGSAFFLGRAAKEELGNASVLLSNAIREFRRK